MCLMRKDEILEGGNSNDVIRQGITVVRKTGVWSPFVHAFLEYLTAAGFHHSPVLLEHSDTTERLSFRPGEVGHYPLKSYLQSDAVLMEAARLLRRLHDLSQGFPIPLDSTFQLAPQTPHEVICHNDFAPYNCVFADNHLVGIIDFDTASPGTRIWDIAYAIYRFAPLTNDQHSLDCGWCPIPYRIARLKLFCDSYGLQNRDAIIPTVIRRLQLLVDHMRQTASNLDHVSLYLADLAYIEARQAAWTDAIK